jgi:hypothetical protein
MEPSLATSLKYRVNLEKTNFVAVLFFATDMRKRRY